MPAFSSNLKKVTLKKIDGPIDILAKRYFSFIFLLYSFFTVVYNFLYSFFRGPHLNSPPLPGGEGKLVFTSLFSPEIDGPFAHARRYFPPSFFYRIHFLQLCTIICIPFLRSPFF